MVCQQLRSAASARLLILNNPPLPFNIRSGIQQVCIGSPILFLYAADRVLASDLHGFEGVKSAPGIIGADQKEVVLEDFEDLLPPFLLSEQASSSRMTSRTSSLAGSVSSCISSAKPNFLPVHGHKPAGESTGTTTSVTDDCSDCSSDVVIVEECEISSRAGRAKARRQSSRILRTRSLNAIQPRPASKNSRLARKSRRSTLIPSKRPMVSEYRFLLFPACMRSR
ncbi:unnamed protein product [Schistocephalus solidus]|uniref:Uncharacterized protein n=1 Tax=Schistocephalus solidus TaxID=70667 RepID=A0A183S9L3_SCHSO|nr:unnamed protein product [Schistocephalus solidus]